VGAPFFTEGDSQPQGIKVDPSGKFLYVALSNSGNIAAFTIDGATGALTGVPDSPFPTASTQFTRTYQLTIVPSGKFLYAFNFNGSTMAAFTIDSTSDVLTTVTGSPFPVIRNGEGEIIVDPSGKFLSKTIGFSPPAFVIFDIDPNTGALTPNPESPVAGSQEPFGLAAAQIPAMGVAQALDIARTTNTGGAPFLRALCERGEPRTMLLKVLPQLPNTHP